MYTYVHAYIHMYIHTYGEFSVGPNPVDASKIKISATNNDINVIWKVCCEVSN